MLFLFILDFMRKKSFDNAIQLQYLIVGKKQKLNEINISIFDPQNMYITKCMKIKVFNTLVKDMFLIRKTLIK